MIKNEKQYKISRAQLQVLASAINATEEQYNSNVHPLLIQAQKEAIKSQYDELYKEIEEYEYLKEGRYSQLEIESFDLLPQGLIRARIAKGLSHKDLADKLGLKEQQIQRYEATNYATASFDKLKDIIAALGVSIREDIFLSNSAYNESILFKNLAKIGIAKKFVIDKLVPSSLAYKLQIINQLAESEAKNAISTIASIVSKIFQISIEQLFSPSSSLSLNTGNINAVRYKKAINANKEKVSAYTVYAHLLALSIYEASKIKSQLEIPEDPFEIRRVIIERYGSINFDAVLAYTWSLGIPVIALNDPGAFHGACWRIEGFNVIILKQTIMSEARWINDLLHELCHAGQHPEQKTLDIIENEEVSKEDLENDDEVDANYFAGEVFLGETVDSVAEECIEQARGNLVYLKSSVEKLAKKHNMSVGGLANYIAFRLMKEQNRNWWGSANNLQSLGFSPWNSCKELILSNCDLDSLNEFDRDLFIRAIM